MRAKRIALFTALILVFAAVIFFLPRLIDRHPYVDTSGEIVYASDRGTPGKSHLFLVKADGSGLRQITRGAGSDTQPSFSPDGTQIAFVSDRSGSPQVYVMSADGTGARAISLGSDQKLSPQFSSDDQSVGYISRGQLLVTSIIGGRTSLVLPTNQNVSSTSTANLSGAARSPVVAFAWSPSHDAADEYKLAAVQQSPDSDLQTVAIVDTGNASAAPVVVGGGALASIAWSPDGQQLAAALIGASGPDGQPQNVSGIADFKPDGTELYSSPIAPVQSGTTGAQNPAFSPQGQKIIFGIVQLSKLGTPVPGGLAGTAAQPNSEVKVLLRAPAHNPAIARDEAHFLFLGPMSAQSPAQSLFVGDPTTGRIKALTAPAENVTSAEWSPAVPHRR